MVKHVQRVRPSYAGGKRAHYILYAAHQRARRRVMEYYKKLKGKYAFADLNRDLLLREEERLEKEGILSTIQS